MKAGNNKHHSNMNSRPAHEAEGKGYTNYNTSSSNKNPYVNYSPLPTSNSTAKRPIDKMFDTLNLCGKRVEGATRAADTMADSIWNHLRMSPNLGDAAMARLNQGTKVLTSGGIDRVFQQTFDYVMIGEKLLHSYACYLSTSIGPVIGVLYISNKRIAFCSDFAHYFFPGQPTLTYYKVVVQLDQLKTVNPSANRWNPSEKYIHIVTRDGHEFWFMGFIYYDKALMNLTQALVELHNLK